MNQQRLLYLVGQFLASQLAVAEQQELLILLQQIESLLQLHQFEVCNRSSQIVKTFRYNLDQHFRQLVSGIADRPLRVQDYADLQHLHVNYFSRVISIQTGRSVSTWIADKTITEARILLKDATLTIKDVANRLGFLESAHFSNHFKKHTSLSPAEYRKLATHAGNYSFN